MRKLKFFDKEYEAERIEKKGDEIYGRIGREEVFSFKGITDFSLFELEGDYDLAVDVEEVSRVNAVEALKAMGLKMEMDIEAEAKIAETLIEASGIQLPVIEDGSDWAVGEFVKKGSVRKYKESLYECVQGHITQADWTPDKAAALWKTKKEPGQPWVQPTGAHDAYGKGDVVTHKGRTWVSEVDANVWEPGVYGWKEEK